MLSRTDSSRSPVVQPGSVNTKTVVATGSLRELGGEWFDPFCDLQVIGFAGDARLVARGDGHTIGEGKRACPNQDGTNPYRNGVS